MNALTFIIQLLFKLVLITAAIALSPVLLVFILINCHLHPQDCGLFEVVIGVFGPLFFCVWFAGIVRFLERHYQDTPALGEGSGRAAGLAAYFCITAYIGVILSTMLGLRGEDSLWVMVFALFLPAILYFIWRLVNLSPDEREYAS